PTVRFEPRYFRQIVRTLRVEAVRISGAVRVLHLQELAGIVKGPAVEGAGVGGFIAALEAAEHGAAMRTRIDECVQLTVTIARNKDRLAAHIGREIVVL